MCTSAVKASHLFLTFSSHIAELELQGTRQRKSERKKEGDREREKTEKTISLSQQHSPRFISQLYPFIPGPSSNQHCGIINQSIKKKFKCPHVDLDQFTKMFVIFLSALGHLLQKISGASITSLKICVSFRIV